MGNLPILEERVRTYAPWSHSKAGTAEHCTAQFSKQYIEKLPKVDVYEESKIGIAVHAVIELFLKNDDFARLVDLHKDFTVKRAAVMSLFEEVAADPKIALTENERESALQHVDNVVQFLDWVRRFVIKHKVQKLFVEYKMGFNEGFQNTGFWDGNPLYRGVIDLGMLTGNNYFIVIDHKSSARMKPIYMHEDQLKGYALFAEAKFPNLKGVQSFIHYTFHGDETGPKLVPGKLITAEEIRESFRPWLLDFLNRSTAALAKPVTTAVGWWCNWCGYRSTCPDGNKRESKKTSE